ncbi:hypothetical protein B7767_34865 [Streptomyces sp. 13-12-16]|nr:hypothetical protein B7767_34865 [Streptomyces sp. 13-12-16]
MPLYLRPRVDPPLASLLGAAPFLHSLVDPLGSPLDVLVRSSSTCAARTPTPPCPSRGRSTSSTSCSMN